MVYQMIKRNKQVLAYKETWMQGNEQNKVRTIVYEVSSVVGTLYKIVQFLTRFKLHALFAFITILQFLFSNKTKNYNADDVQPYSYIDLAQFVSMTGRNCAMEGFWPFRN